MSGYYVLFILVNLAFFVSGVALGIAIESWRSRAGR